MAVLPANSAAKLAIGVDIGGTTAKLGLVNAKGSLLARKTFPTQTYQDPMRFGLHLADFIQEMISTSAQGSEVCGIGIGAPGVDEQAGAITAAANLPFKEPFPLGRFIEQQTGIPATLIKDSSAAILGENAFGGAQGMEHFVLLTLGTGLGSALMIHGRVITGGNGLASEYGHSPAVTNGRQCNCGKKGCLETYVSAPGIKRTVFELLARDKEESTLRNLSFTDMDAKQIHEAAMHGDRIAVEAFRQTGIILGRAIAGLIVLLDPQAVFLAGGLTQAGPVLLDPVLEGLDEHLLPMFRGSCEVRLSTLGGEDTGILGAAALMLT